MAAVILLDVMTRYERGEITEEQSRDELRQRLGWEPARREHKLEKNHGEEGTTH
jgi:hypothetical protein